MSSSCVVQIHNDGDGDGDSIFFQCMERPWTNRTYVRWFGCMLEFEGVVISSQLVFDVVV